MGWTQRLQTKYRKVLLKEFSKSPRSTICFWWHSTLEGLDDSAIEFYSQGTTGPNSYNSGYYGVDLLDNSEGSETAMAFYFNTLPGCCGVVCISELSGLRANWKLGFDICKDLAKENRFSTIMCTAVKPSFCEALRANGFKEVHNLVNLRTANVIRVFCFNIDHNEG